MMERATVSMAPSDPGMWAHVVSIAAAKILEGTPNTSFVAYERNPDAGFGASAFECKLRFRRREWDPAAKEVRRGVGDIFTRWLCIVIIVTRYCHYESFYSCSLN
jgi:hypothetical protein